MNDPRENDEGFGRQFITEAQEKHIDELLKSLGPVETDKYIEPSKKEQAES
jgi:hypothetical protein